MKNNVAFIIAIVLVLVFNQPALADMAPPEPAPGSDINPGQETKVRMVAENVLMVIKEVSPDVYVLEVNADFAMKNLGDTDEQMQARFPLENISGLGNGWTDLPTEVWDFRVSVNKSPVPTKVVEQTYQSNGIPINWAIFDVNFPTNQDVLVHVSYETGIQNYDSPSFIEYIIGTGEGWYESIGSATITLRFPYAVSLANTLWFDSQSEGVIPENVVIIGKEIRWHWENYEPATDKTVRVAVVNPVQWQNILDLEYKTGNNPNDIDSVLELSRKYQRAGSNKEYISTSTLADLAEIAVQQALALHPNDIRLHLELAEIYNERRWLEEDPYTQKLQDELDVILELEPTNQRALELKSFLEQDLAKSHIPIPSATPTKIVIRETPTEMVAPTQIPTAITMIQPEILVEKNNVGLQVFTGAFLLVVGFVTGTIFTRKKQKPL